MKILGRDRGSGSIRLLPETDEDLWHLYNVLEAGDLVTASTTRREEKAADKIRAEKAEKRRMTLGIRVEKVEFSEDDLRLRALGIIESGPQDIGQYHTVVFEPGDKLTLSKEHWRGTQLDRLERAVADTDKPRLAFVSLDQDEATVAVLRQYGLKELALIRSGRSGKQYIEKGRRDTYHDEITEKLAAVLEPGMPLAVLGPGFEKETLAEHLRRKGVENLHVYHTGHCGMTGVNELIKTGMGSEMLRESAAAAEMEAVEELMAGIGKDGAVTYGPAEVAAAAAAGAVETLLILDSRLRETDMDELVRAVEAQNGRIVIVSEHHDGGRMLDSLGGTGALLRYRI